MKKGIAKSEANSGISLTIPVRTRTPLEAFELLRQGQPVDRVAGYYAEQGMDITNFFLLDKVEKLHKIAEFKQNEALLRAEIDSAIINHQNQIKVNEENQITTKQQAPGGAVGSVSE